VNGSLEQVLEQVRCGNPPAFWTYTIIAKFIIGMAIGLGNLHSLGAIHAGVKPENLLIDNQFHVRICGFSNATLANSEQAMRIHVVTPLYSAPEMFTEEKRKTEKVDVFAFALIVYEILFDATVLPRSSNLAHVAHCACRNARRPAIPDGAVPQVVKRLIKRCWSAEPDDRPWFEEVVSDLRICNFRLYPDVDANAIKSYVSTLRQQ
jgi:serine/threonine protein kinase